ncbi:MAG: alanine racemase [Patescibacteria group bacterium]
MLISFLKKIRKPNYQTLNIIQISADRLSANFRYLQSLQPNATIIPVLKSNAYGHGLREICQIIKKQDVKMVAVDSFPEAQIVYRYFSGKVLILGEMPLDAYLYCRPNKTEFCVYNDETLKFLATKFFKPKIHLFVNTGMNREGIKDLPAFLERNKEIIKKVKVTGLCSHLASADTDSYLNKKQEQNFINCLDILNSNKIYPNFVHLGNSAGAFILANPKLNSFRCGLSFYGYNPFPSESRYYEAAKALAPALRVSSQVVSLQNIESGEEVSYNGTYHAENKEKIAVIPFGYHEGLPRNLSNKFQFKVTSSPRSFWAASAGRICMNLSCLQIGEEKIQIGNSVEIISWDKSARNSLENLSRSANIIPYEFLVRLDSKIRREVVK